MPSSWLPISKDSHFSLANIPFGVISTSTSQTPRAAIAIGDHALDLAAFAAGGGFAGLSASLDTNVFSRPTLNVFAALGRPVHRQVREYLQDVFSEATKVPHVLKDNASLRETALLPLKSIKTHLPLDIGDYTDFYAGLNHAFNVGCLFRGPDNALQPNYHYLPVGYHGRASSVVVSGTPIRRPWGQVLTNPTAEKKVPEFIPCKRLDIELELGAFVCRPNEMGQPIPVDDAADYIFGVVLMNDWSARDIQTWEYVPLGPFNSKNFGTTISAWVVLTDALEPFLEKGLPNKNDEIISYLKESKEKNMYDIKLEVDLKTQAGNTTNICKTSSSNLLWSFAQMLAHHSITGCPMRTGDLLGSGTISGTEDGSQGSLLEQNKSGKSPIVLQGEEKRTFLEDGDTVTIRGYCVGKEGELVGFGECVGEILPAHKA